MDAPGVPRHRGRYVRGKRQHATPSSKTGSPPSNSPSMNAGSPAGSAAGSAAGSSTTAAAGQGGQPTVHWSHDPGAAAAGLLDKHGRKLFWGAILLYFVCFTDVPIRKVLAWIAIGAVGLLVLMLVRQDSMLYHPVVDPRLPRKPAAHLNPRSIFKLDYEELLLPTADGPTIHAWLIFAPMHRRRECHTLVFLHGNAGNIAHRLPNYAKLVEDVGVNILAVEYRGFGASTGSPSEAGLKEDVAAALKFLHSRNDLHRGKIVLFGRSLGGAVAIAAAAVQGAHEKLSGLIIENSFTSVVEMAKSVLPLVRVLGPALPRFVRNKWESENAIKAVKSPILFLSGEQDKLVPPAQMRKLRQAATSARHCEWRSFPLGGHNDTFMKGGDAYYRAIRSFLETHCVPASVVAAANCDDPTLPSSSAQRKDCPGGDGDGDGDGADLGETNHSNASASMGTQPQENGGSQPTGLESPANVPTSAAAQ